MRSSARKGVMILCASNERDQNEPADSPAITNVSDYRCCTVVPEAGVQLKHTGPDSRLWFVVGTDLAAPLTTDTSCRTKALGSYSFSRGPCASIASSKKMCAEDQIDKGHCTLQTTKRERIERRGNEQSDERSSTTQTCVCVLERSKRTCLHSKPETDSH